MYFWITGILAFIALIPSAVTYGLFFFIVPGFILMIAPTLFLYSLGIKIFLNAYSSMSPEWRWLRAVCSLAGVLVAISLILNLPTFLTIHSLRTEDKFITAPVHLPDTIALFFDVKDNVGLRIPLSCAELCQRLLYNGAVKRVMVDYLTTIDKAALTKTVRFYYISRQESCPPAPVPETSGFWPGDKNYNQYSFKNDAVKMRVAAGECLLEGSASLSEAKMILAEREIRLPDREAFDDQWNIFIDTLRARRMVLFKKTANGLEVIDHKTQVQADILFMPLAIGPVESHGIEVRLGFMRMPISFNLYSDWRWNRAYISDEFRRLFGDAVKLPSEPSEQESGLAGLLNTALNKHSPEADSGLQLFDSYLQSIIQNKGGTADDVQLIARAIAETRIKNFFNLANAVRSLGIKSISLAKPMVDRAMSAVLPEEMDVVGEMGWGINALPEGAAVQILPELEKLARMPEYRGIGWYAVSRLRDGGEAALPVLGEIINTPSSAYNQNPKDAEVVIGALTGLCKMGDKAKGAKDDLIKYLHSSLGKPVSPNYTGLAIETLGHFMSIEELQSEVGGYDFEKEIRHSGYRPCNRFI